MTNALIKPLRTRLRRLADRLRGDTSGLALVEFAFAAPIVLGLGMLGTDTAFLVITHLQISQIAMQVADNTSRLGEAEVLTQKRVFESDIAEVLIGAERLGEELDIFDRGRIIISSLQRNDDGGQWIAWQRCRGDLPHISSYGVEGDGETGTSFPGMGEPGREITASSGTAVMFVEVAYHFESITPIRLFQDQIITYTAAFNIRDNRDLSGLYEGGPVARCSVFSRDRPT